MTAEQSLGLVGNVAVLVQYSNQFGPKLIYELYRTLEGLAFEYKDLDFEEEEIRISNLGETER